MIDAMGTQKAMAERIRKKRADYVLALKGSQARLYEDVELCFGDREKRKYYQMDEIGWLPQRKEWKEIKSLGMEEKTIRDEKGRTERIPVLYQQPYAGYRDF